MRSTFQITVLISAEFSFQRSTHFRSSHFRSSHFSRVLIFTEFSFSQSSHSLSEFSFSLRVLISAEFSFQQSSHFRRVFSIFCPCVTIWLSSPKNLPSVIFFRMTDCAAEIPAQDLLATIRLNKQLTAHYSTARIKVNTCFVVHRKPRNAIEWDKQATFSNRQRVAREARPCMLCI